MLFLFVTATLDTLYFLNLITFTSFCLFADFDEQTADDWDVDMSVYYDKGISFFLTSVFTLMNSTVLFLQSDFL